MALYLVLSSQKLVPGAGSGISSKIYYYGDFLYLSEDLSHFYLKDEKYNIWLKNIETQTGLHQNSARSGRKGITNADMRMFHYYTDSPEKLDLTIVQTKSVNPYLHDKYEFDYVIFAGMRFELIVPGQIF
jgi:hypothetical protein